ncbi:MAG TPA: enolase C-terminal domain-like protein [bacterium]|nr:enolase C-terminal domain-like protein [bacterium]
MTRIEQIEVIPVRYPTVGFFKFFKDGRPAVIIKITADDGTVGWGQSVPIPTWSYETLESCVTTLKQYIVPKLIGLDPFDLDSIHRAMDAAISPSFSTGMPIAKAGVDIALHDLAGKLLGVNLAQRWGKRSGGEIRLSWTLNPRSLDEIESLIDEGWQRGYRNFNVKVAPDPTFDLELCRRVKERVPDGFLWADANGGYDPATALWVAPKLADIGVSVLEQPVKANRLAAYRDLRRQGALPIILDEGVVSPSDLIEFLRLDILDGVAMKPARCGGLLSARRQVEILLDAGLMFLGSGLTDPDISLSASVALYAAYDLKVPAALNGPQFLGYSVLASSDQQPMDGKISAPTGPGLGIEPDESRIEAIRV